MKTLAMDRTNSVTGKSVSRPASKSAKLRASSLVTSKTLKPGFAKRQTRVAQDEQFKSVISQLKAERDMETQVRKQMRKKKIEMQAENERKAAHIITNVNKLKKLRKSQLRGIVKR